MTRDEELKGLIQEALLEDARLSSQRIDVSVNEGVVRLRGQVQSHRRRLAARSVAASFEGCRDLVDELVVEPPHSIPDAEVAENVRMALAAHADITKETITVAVSNGSVTLEGSVTGHWERLLAEDVALSARGARRVNNRLCVDLLDHVEDAANANAIQLAIRQVRELRETGVRVAVTGGTVVLSGEVRALWQKELAMELLHRFRVRNIRDEISIVP